MDCSPIIGDIVAHGSYGGCFSGGFLAVWTILDDETDGLFDSHPMEFFSDGSGCFVDAAVLQRVHISGDLVLSLRITHYLLVFQH